MYYHFFSRGRYAWREGRPCFGSRALDSSFTRAKKSVGSQKMPVGNGEQRVAASFKATSRIPTTQRLVV